MPGGFARENRPERFAQAHLCFSPMRFEIGNNRNNWKKQRAYAKGMLFQTVVSHNQKARR